MALNIKNPETEKLARELARRRNQGITEVVTDVLRKEVERERRKPARIDDRAERMRRVELLREFKIEIVPFDERQADIARDAFIRFGKGRHKAALNFGDCAAYALAVAEAEPLLFKGTDFGATDVEVAQLREDG